MDKLFKYFPHLTDLQQHQFETLGTLYKEWNEKINVISRKDIDHLYLHHVLHSLAIAKFISFKPNSNILDLGTGGGFPGIPLAILFPECQFTLVDSINKKIMVVNEVVASIGLQNVKTIHGRGEEIKQKYDFVVTRAVAKLDKLLPWSRKILSTNQKNTYPNGLIALKGNPKDELKLIPRYEYSEAVHIVTYFDEPYFDQKFVLYIQG